MTAIAAERLATLVIARLASSARPPGLADLVKGLRRFSPRELTDAQWRQTVAGVLDELRAGEIIDDKRRVREGELARRLGGIGPQTWKQLAERVLPAVALGVEAGDGKAQARLDSRDAWAAAIAARALGVGRAGPPPSPSAVGDALVWQALELGGAPKRCPPEVRAYFVHRHVSGDAGPVERLLRAFAAQVVGAPRVELQALRDGLVRLWLAGREVTARAEAAAPSLLADVQAAAAAAAAAREGVFGDRKVFISAIWERLRAMPAWTSLELHELKARLIAAHRNNELVLARADLVSAMDPALVAASEIRAGEATFHFVIREPST